MSAPVGFTFDSEGYVSLAGKAGAKGPVWRGVERYLTERSHAARVAEAAEQVTAQDIIDQRRAAALVAYKAACAELDGGVADPHPATNHLEAA